MRLRELLVSSCVSVMTVFAVPAPAAVHECAPGKPTAASYTWNFKAEANNIFRDLQYEARQAKNHADRLRRYSQYSDVSWQTQGDELTALRQEINDMGTKLCRLESIRRVLAPWQQNEIDRMAADARLMADNTRDAILFMNGHQQQLWLPPYQQYAANLYDQTLKLEHSADDAVAYASVSADYQNLRHKLGMRSSS